MSPLEDCCYHCAGCGRSTCRDERPSPREASSLCVDCYEVELPGDAA